MSDRLFVVLAMTAVLAIAVAIGVVIWNRKQKQTQKQQDQSSAVAQAITDARNTPLPNGAVAMRSSSMQDVDRPADGRIMLVLIGTYGSGIGRKLLSALANAGLDHAVGSVILLEFDAGRRAVFMDAVPSVFAEKVVTIPGGTPMAAGFSAATPEEAEATIAYWGPTVLGAVQEGIATHMRLNQASPPGIIMPMVGIGGGHSFAGVRAISLLVERVTNTPVYGWGVLPEYDRVRLLAQQVMDAYKAAGVRGWVLTDNLQDEVANDFGVIASIAAMIAAPRNADAATEINNVLVEVLEKSPGQIATLTTFTRSIPAYSRSEWLPGEYWVFRGPVQTALTDGTKSIRAQKDSLGVDPPHEIPEETSVFDLVFAPIIPSDLLSVGDDVIEGMRMRGEAFRNYQIQFASAAAYINPSRPECNIGVVQLRPLVDAETRLSEVARAIPHRIRPIEDAVTATPGELVSGGAADEAPAEYADNESDTAAM